MNETLSYLSFKMSQKIVYSIYSIKTYNYFILKIKIYSIMRTKSLHKTFYIKMKVGLRNQLRMISSFNKCKNKSSTIILKNNKT